MRDFYTSVSCLVFSQESERQREEISSCLLNSPQYSGLSKKCCIQDGLDPSTDFQFFQSTFRTSGDFPCAPTTNGITVTLMFHIYSSSLAKDLVSAYLFVFYYFHSVICSDSNGGARGVMVIVTGYEYCDTSSNSWTRLIAFHIALIPLGKV